MRIKLLRRVAAAVLIASGSLLASTERSRDFRPRPHLDDEVGFECVCKALEDRQRGDRATAFKASLVALYASVAPGSRIRWSRTSDQLLRSPILIALLHGVPQRRSGRRPAGSGRSQRPHVPGSW